MKTATIACALGVTLSGVSGFMVPTGLPAVARTNGRTGLRMSEGVEGAVEEVVGAVEEAVEEVAPVAPVMPEAPRVVGTSAALPFMDRPSVLDSVALAGDSGFDPFGLAKDTKTLLFMREAEIKHCRLAMLAAAGWPLAELFDKSIAGALGVSPAPIEVTAGLSPSLLNGGLGQISPLYWGFVLGLSSAVEIYERKVKADSADHIAGDLGFDPFGLYPTDAAGQMTMRTKEIKNGRMAMVAIVLFAAQEFLFSTPVSEGSSVFFKPLPQVLGDYFQSMNTFLQ